MDAKEFFEKIVIPNYEDAIKNPTDLRKTYNAIITVNTMAEFLALHQFGYVEGLTEGQLAEKANEIRRHHTALERVKYHAEVMKHVRKLHGTDKNISPTISSTEFATEEPKSWEHLRPDLEQAMSVLKTLVI
jgi:hypothetical protein